MISDQEHFVAATLAALNDMYAYAPSKATRLLEYLQHPGHDTFIMKARDGKIVHTVREEHEGDPEKGHAL